MEFVLICIGSLVALGIVAALVSMLTKGGTDAPIVEGRDCSTCEGVATGECKIGCMMEEKKRRQGGASTTLLLLVALAVVAGGCSTHKNTAKNRLWQSFTARYNTYYNGHQAYIDASLEKEKGNKDNYTELLPLYPVGNKQSRELGSGNYARAIEKMEKTIKQHSIKGRPEWKKSRRKTAKDIEWLSRREYNPFLWKAWLMLGQAQFHKGAFDEAAATFSYMSRLYQSQPMQVGMARAWLANCYTELNWLYDAEDVIRNTTRDSIHYRAQPAWDQTMANYYLRQADFEHAAPLLRKVIKRERRKTQKARLWFIMGQIQAAMGNSQAAYKAYNRVVAQNPPYELEFNARIAQTEVLAANTSQTDRGNTARKLIGRLKRMAHSDKNKDYLDQVYYAIGNIYLAQADTARAIAAYEQGNEKGTRSGIEKGVLLLRLGNLYWEMEKYNDAQRCYGTAIGLLDKDRPDYEELSQRSKVLDELVPHTDAVHLQDSLQELARMPEADRMKAIDRVIDELKRKEKEERDKEREAAVEAAQQKQGAVGNRMGQNQQRTTPQANQPAGQNGAWYFYNPMAVNQGKQTFQRQWGKRDNADNWRRANQTVVNLNTETPESPEEADNAENNENTESTPSLAADSLTAGGDTAETDTLANDPHNREYYLAQIPFTEEAVEASNLIIMDGLYNSGVIFKDKLDNLTLSEKQLVRLTTQYPDFAQMDLAWYHMFLLYSRRGENDKAQECLKHLQADFPESDYTILLSDPYFVENQRFGVHIEDSIYAATYNAFKQSRHEEIATNAKLSAERFPLGANRPKFLFIHGLSLLNQGDAPGCVEQLKQVVEKYPQSEVTEMAGMIIKGVQEGRTLHGGTFDLDAVWDRRDMSLNTDSLAADTLSADRDVPFLFMLVYQPDTLAEAIGTTPLQAENQLLYEMARFNFTNFLVRNFDLQIERFEGYSRMAISGFLNFDEALQYARQLTSAPELSAMLKECRTVVVSEHNLTLIGTRYSFRDYDQFYERTFLPLKISNEELLQIPQDIVLPEEEDDEEESADDGSDDDFMPQQPTNQRSYTNDFDPDFW